MYFSKENEVHSHSRSTTVKASLSCGDFVGALFTQVVQICMKTAFRFCLRLRCLSSAYDLVKTRLSESESEAEAEEPNQSQSVGTCTVIGLSFRLCFRLRQSG